MSIGNILLGLIAFCMVALLVGATVALFYFKNKITPKKKLATIEVESLDPKLTQGYGFIVNDKLILKDDKTPYLCKEKSLAEQTLKEFFHGKGKIIYQKWDMKTQQVRIGEVREHGAN